MSLNFILFKAIEEQQVVNFTGKINILKSHNKEYIGCLYLIDGVIVNGTYNDLSPLKAIIKLFSLYQVQDEPLEIIVEPELLSASLKKVDYPNEVLKRKIEENIGKLNGMSSQRPPDDLKLFIKPEFIKNGGDVSHHEYKVLSVISDNNLVKDIYKNCDLFEFEITDALVSLRKKEALKVIEFK